MPEIHDFLSKTWQKKAWNHVRVAAGPRYTSEVNVNTSIEELFEGLGRTKLFFSKLDRLTNKVEHELFIVNPKEDVPVELKIKLEKITLHSKDLIKETRIIIKNKKKFLAYKKINELSNKINRLSSPVWRIVYNLEQKEREEQKLKNETENKKTEYIESSRIRELKSLERRSNNLISAVRSLQYFVNSYSGKSALDPVVLILGQAGIGKTHLLCDIAKNRINNNLPTFIILGEELTKVDDPLKCILKALQLNISKKKFLEKINQEGERKKARSLIFIDAINESDKPAWKKKIKPFIKEIKKYPWVGIVLTCRIPFENISVPNRFKIIKVHHQGFEDVELEAMQAFFNFYKLPLPEVPLLISEFSSPLFLSSFCKTASNIKQGKKQVAKTIKDLALGQKGMTTILEDFYKTKEKLIVQKSSTDTKYSGYIYTGYIWSNKCIVKEIAKIMALKKRNYLHKPEIIRALNTYYEKSSGPFDDLIKILIENNILIEDLSWNSDSKSYENVYKFSFHKFSDHIIARYLLEKYLKKNKIRKSLSYKNYLGKFFSSHDQVQNNADLVEALMVEFTERLKKDIRFDNKDIIDYVKPEIKNTVWFANIFVRSLYWRSPDNFINKSKKLKKSLNQYINHILLSTQVKNEFFNLLVSTSIKPFHPLSSGSLHDYLFKMTLVRRDLYWSEFLRKQYSSGSVSRLVEWIEKNDISKITEEQAISTMTVLAWCLTTVNHQQRDRVSRCIYLIASVHPSSFFKIALNIMPANDPNIRERLLGVGYGICMSIQFSKKENDQQLIFSFAKTIFNQFFKRGAILTTTHVITRDYAKSIIELALKNNKQLLNTKQKKRLNETFNSGKIRKWGHSKDKNKNEYRNGDSPLHYDFENTELGRLVPGRQSHDYKHKGFLKVKGNIFWRIYKLGYSLELFSPIDQEIARNRHSYSQDERGWIDTYGMKYSKIAFFELFGFMLDQKVLKDTSWLDPRGRDDSKIDVSFPSGKEIILKKQNYITNRTNIKQWLVNAKNPDFRPMVKVKKILNKKGPWVLVGGFTEQHTEKLARKINIFIQSVLIDKDKINKATSLLNTTKHPGNETIPHLNDTRNTFWGELGWNEKLKNKEEDDRVISVYLKTVRKKVNINLPIPIYWAITNSNRSPRSIRYRYEAVYEKIPVNVIYRHISTYNYLRPSADNTIGLYIPSKKIMKFFHLHALPESFGLFDKNNELSTISIYNGNPYHTHQNLLYIKEDLLNKILKKYKQKLLLFVWGERRHWPKKGLEYGHRSDLSPIYQKYKNIHKQFFVV